MNKTPMEKFNDFIEENKIQYQYNFVPLSFSRNAKEVTAKDWDKPQTTSLFKDKHICLNWKVSIKGHDHVLNTDYQKGIGHLDYDWLNYQNPPLKSLMDVERANKIIYDGVEKGIAYSLKSRKEFDAHALLHKKEFPNPSILEIVQCLVLDCEVKDYQTFESWADDMGMDKDSRKHEKIYNSCKQTAVDFLKIVGGEKNFDQLRQIIWEIDNEPIVSNHKNKP